MNGEVKSYRMNSPISWKEFKQWPDEHKMTYIKLLREKYNAPDSGIAKMMGINVASFSQEMQRLGLNVGHKKVRKWDSEGFYAWVSGVPVKKEEEPIPEAKGEEPVPVVEEETEEYIPEESTENAKCGVLNYAAAYEEAMHELEKANAEIYCIREELERTHNEARWLYGFKAAVEVIFGKGELNG